ncbi:hypothetical protein [Thalassomonas sp. RHCl1]|uniref:hypothetical protein n=1 Tax=Thalassomonas sp. RHCl1 TaxID=2995320 RepID=UPI00248C79C7|nr:hypothetical protein [Thalassomonas sp. RHCl1]
MSFLNTQSLPVGYQTSVEIVDAFKNGELFFLITNKHEAIFLRKEAWKVGDYLDEDEPGYSLEQFTLPLSAIPWLVDIIENKFWRKSSQGGVPAEVLHYKNTFDAEEVKIRFTPNCQKEFEPGITILNLSRPDGRSKYSELAIPYYTLRDKRLLQAMKSI